MKKKLLGAVLAAISISGVCWIAFSSRASSANPTAAFQQVLNAHGGREAIAAVTAFRTRARRLTFTAPSVFFERQLLVEVDGVKFRRLIVDSPGVRTQAELFDGQSGFKVVSDLQRKPPEALLAQPMNARRLSAVSSSIETSNLLRLLQRCADPATKIIAQASGPGSLNKFQIQTGIGEWLVYADQSHLIRQIEIGTRQFQFADYRAVGRLHLPFTERLSANQQWSQELTFSTIELNPDFPADYFTPAALSIRR